MEITDYFRGARARLALLLVVPALAMAGTALLQEQAEPGQRAVATVVLTPPSGVTGGVALSQAVESFRAALGSDSVVDAAAEATGVPAGAIRDSVRSRRLGTSGVVEVIYEGPSRPGLDELLQTQTEGATELLFRSELASAEREVELAQERVDEATDRLETARADAGVVLAEEASRAKLSEISSLNVGIAQARSRGDSTAPLEEALAAAEEELATLSSQTIELEQPRLVLERARSALFDAESRADATQARLDVSRSPVDVRVGVAAAEVQTVSLVRRIAAAGVAGLVVAIVLLAVLEVVRPRRRRPAPPSTRPVASDRRVAPASGPADPDEEPDSRRHDSVGAGVQA